MFDRQMPMKRFRDDLTHMINRFFDEPFGHSPSSFIPTINVKEEAERYVVEAEVPGMDLSDIEIEVSGNILTIRGERKSQHQHDHKQKHFVESSYGAFHRSFTLPDHVNVDQITADTYKGMLTIHIPKDQTNQARKIEITDRDQTADRQQPPEQY